MQSGTTQSAVKKRLRINGLSKGKNRQMQGCTVTRPVASERPIFWPGETITPFLTNINAAYCIPHGQNDGKEAKQGAQNSDVTGEQFPRLKIHYGVLFQVDVKHGWPQQHSPAPVAVTLLQGALHEELINKSGMLIRCLRVRETLPNRISPMKECPWVAIATRS